MSPFSDFHPNEEILRQERLHSGIFALPVMLFVALLLPTLPVLFFLNMMGNMIGQFSPQGSRSPLSILWVFPIAIGLLPALLFFFLVLAAYLNSQIILTNKRLGEGTIRERYGNLCDMYERITDENPYKVPMRIFPAAHYVMGGLWVDYNLMSTIPGLHVAGEHTSELQSLRHLV